MTQDQALSIMEHGKNVLLTGAAGTGKTYVLNQFIARARRRGKSVAVTATTGLAATHLNGNTIHAWSGIGVHTELPRNFAEKVSKGRRDAVLKADVLVIDEISMLHDFRLDLVDQALRAVRGDFRPFGGIQIILCGDFFQLPPVNRGDERAGTFVVRAESWEPAEFVVCYLTKQYRQSDDEVYAELLNGIRQGVLRRSQMDQLQGRIGIPLDVPAMTRLLTTNVDVDAINQRHLADLTGDVHSYTMTTSGSERYVEQLKRSCLAPEVLRLKAGALVMCIKNSTDRRYANGSLGKVIDFEPLTDHPVVELNNGREIVVRPDTWELRDGDRKRASLTQLPLRLAWAITVHKSQGMTLDAAQVDLTRAFVEGMGYVALSRVKSLQSLSLDGMNAMALKTSQLARELDGHLQAASDEAADNFAHIFAAWQEQEALEATKPKTTKQNEAADEPIDFDPELYSALRAWRAVTAQSAGMPPYIIAHDKALKLVAARKPQTAEDLLRVPGFGPKRVADHGTQIIEIVVNDVPKNAIL